MKNYTFIDLFSGLGGFRLGLEKLGATCVFSSEIDDNVKKVYQKNFGELPNGDITKIKAEEIPDHDILCAGFPCQPFSISGKQEGFEDTRGTLFFDVARIVEEKKPKIVFLENVKNFSTHDKGKTLKTVKKTLENLGYDFYVKVLNAADYGVPQSRERTYMIAVRKDLKNTFQFPKPKPLTKFLKDFLEDEPVDQSLFSEKEVSWNNNTDHTSNKPVRLGQVGQGRQGERVYGIKGTAITLSAHGGGTFSRTGGYLINGKVRKLSPRECANIMGFPKTYLIDESSNQAYKQFGNSVVVDVITAIAEEIEKTFNLTEGTTESPRPR